MTVNFVVSDTIRSKIAIAVVIAALLLPLVVLAPAANATIEWSCNATGCWREWTAPPVDCSPFYITSKVRALASVHWHMQNDIWYTAAGNSTVWMNTYRQPGWKTDLHGSYAVRLGMNDSNPLRLDTGNSYWYCGH